MRKIIFSNIYERLGFTAAAPWVLLPYFFLSFVLLFLMGDPFYEGGSYMAYAHSMMRDADFNIVNHMPEELTRIVTVNYHHPDGHSEVQTPFLVFIYAIVFFMFKLVPVSVNEQTTALLTGFVINFLALSLMHFGLLKIARLTDVQYKVWDILLFVLGSVCFYFVFNVVNVLEVYFLPIVTYALYLFLKLKKEKSFFDLASYGVLLGLLLSSNFSYKFLSIGLFVFFVISQRNNWKEKILVLFTAVMYPVSHLVNMWLKYGKILDVHQGANHLLEFSLGHFARKLWYGYFLTDFLRSPLTFLSFVVVVMALILLIKKKSQYLSRYEAAFFLFWIGFTTFSYLPFMGDLVEGHLSGRYFLRFAPLLILAIAYMRTKIKTFIWPLALVGLFTTICFIAIDVIDPLIYAERTLLTGLEWEMVAVAYRFKMIQNLESYGLLFIWLLPICLVSGTLAKHFLSNESKMRELNLSLALIFVAMTGMNVVNSDTKITELKQQDFYQDKVIGDGPHIYLIDYALEKLANIERSNSEIDMSQRLENFYQDVEKQVIRSTPQFDQAIAKRDRYWSFYLQQFHYNENENE